ncbi:LacI family DNA-binding transcriptional regulator [Paenibacillus crassostreae]|uniref:LacI family transcriptional regulator n=1 Tax=Paenibacillus crassostreae TaxID=1763538 RepID=A0A167BEI2_9BACL|nr:LacI family DNA-binding transcriptional regulator [Paenibacillus crassostreae]AOZ92912.1 LacI family transcriptional regulator [Paenibacillus crassostreae]OAB71999.1 LacI family transcriptional regulator [Paenibacillus crassostreae]
MGASIKDVAKRAGVSVTSVSRVLNSEKYISQRILEKVNQAIEELNYSPSQIARSLKKQKTSTIGIIVPDLTNYFCSTILSSIEESASEYGYNLIVCNIAENLEKELKYLHAVQEMRVDGIIIMHQKVNQRILSFIESASMPILFSCVRSPLPGRFSVLINDYQAALDATEYLIGLGHRRIAFLGGDLGDVTAGYSRYQGYLDALHKSGIPLNHDFIKFGNYKLESGRVMMQEILEQGECPTVVFAASDDMAVGAMNCILDYGLSVPEDISVMGFDDSLIAKAVRPMLTTMQQPVRELGRISLEYLHTLIEDPDQPDCRDIYLPHRIMERASCRRL